MKPIMLAVVAVGAYFLWQGGYLDNILSGLPGFGGRDGGGAHGGNGGIGGAGGAGGVAHGGQSANGADGEDANGMDANGNDAFASASGSDVHVCTNGHCHHFSGDDISVTCVNGHCHSSNARMYEYRI